MSVQILFIGNDSDWDQYAPDLLKAFETLPFDTHLSRDIAPAAAQYIVMAGRPENADYSRFTKCKAILRLWAGVEDVVHNDTITMPICRMVGGGLDAGMVEWVTAHALRHHIGLDTHIHGQDGLWRNENAPPLAANRSITVLGLGALGAACATALAGLGFRVTGWSKSPKSIPGLRCLNGDVTEALNGAEIVITLLPRTPDTENILNEKTLALLAPGAVVLNPGRGELIDDDALLGALASGQLSHATLDTFRIEPLPQDHPFWAHPKITVTPHIASATRSAPAANVIADNIKRGEAGLPFLHVVDRKAGY